MAAVFPCPAIQIDPRESMVDEEISIAVTGLKPSEKVQLICQAVDEDGKLWRSSALFQADGMGEICLGKQAPVKGSYTGVDPMGLFWSMAPADGTANCFFAAKMIDPISYEISVERKDGWRKSEKLTRLKIGKGIERREIREEGLIGVFFFPKGQKALPALLVLGGSEGNLKENRAALLASRGFATLVLAYFGLEGLPKQLLGIPIEYVQRGAQWLKAQPEADPNKVGLIGSSRGAELALIAASFFPNTFHALAVYVPSCAVYGALPDIYKDAWLYGGKPIAPPAPFPLEESQKEKGSVDRPVACTPYFLQGMQSDRFSQSLIPVEKIDCPLLLISGDADAMWPSSVFCNLIMERLDNARSMINREHLLYPGAGHFIATPYFPTTRQTIFHPAFQTWFAFGGEPQAQANACKDSWKKVIQFFTEALGENR